MDDVGSNLLLKVEYVKYRISGPGKSPIGVLCIFENRVEWSAPNFKEKLMVPFGRIKSSFFTYSQTYSKKLI